MLNRVRLSLVLLLSLLFAVVFLQAFTLFRLSAIPERAGVHTIGLGWPVREIPAGSMASGYVASGKPQVDVVVVAVQVWMGNPLGILWEGDVYVTLNNQGDFQSPDQVVVHYHQFDKHAESSVPHQLWFQIGDAGTGFPVKSGQTVWVWFAFNNISDKTAWSGDGQVIICFLAG